MSFSGWDAVGKNNENSLSMSINSDLNKSEKKSSDKQF